MAGAVSQAWLDCLAAEHALSDDCTGPRPGPTHGVPAFHLDAYDDSGALREVEQWGCGEWFIDGRALPASVRVVLVRELGQPARLHFEYNTGVGPI